MKNLTKVMLLHICLHIKLKSLALLGPVLNISQLFLIFNIYICMVVNTFFGFCYKFLTHKSKIPCQSEYNWHFWMVFQVSFFSPYQIAMSLSLIPSNFSTGIWRSLSGWHPAQIKPNLTLQHRHLEKQETKHVISSSSSCQRNVNVLLFLNLSGIGQL